MRKKSGNISLDETLPLFPKGNPVKGIGELALPPPEPRSLSAAQIKSLKNLCDRLTSFTGAKDAAGKMTRSPGNGETLLFLALAKKTRHIRLI
jgi:hypothetical protein